jgi:hypothetical protein
MLVQRLGTVRERKMEHEKETKMGDWMGELKGRMWVKKRERQLGQSKE